MNKLLAVAILGFCLSACSEVGRDPHISPGSGGGTEVLTNAVVKPDSPVEFRPELSGSLVKSVEFDIDNPESYATLSLLQGDKLLVDRLNIPAKGKQTLTALVRFSQLDNVELTLKSSNANIMINSLVFRDVLNIEIPVYRDVSVQAGLDKESSLKYGGPTVADIDNDGDYDFIVNNHNDASSKLYWNNGDGTVTRHNKNLARWYMHDLHGTSLGDYDNDGDLDLVLSQGGGNGLDPSKANFYKNKEGSLVLMTGDVGIDRGGRGRGSKWTDMDLDGDLDLIIINETSLVKRKPQHFFYENKGDGTFQYREVKGVQDQRPSRSLITDLNGDNIDDLILYSPLSVWQGNGDFTFTDITSQFPEQVARLRYVNGIADIDIDNDGDLDLYLARGKKFEHGRGESPFVDHDPLTKEFSIKTRGYKGVDKFDFKADGPVRLHNYYYLTQGEFRGKDYPLFLGRNKTSLILNSGDETEIDADSAEGWPSTFAEDGMYFGYLGDGRWKVALVRNADNFWAFRFSLSGVTDVTPEFVPENRNIADILLRNDGGKFTDVSEPWKIPTGGNAMGVTVGDFNNDSYQDLFVYRWGNIGFRISDYMLLNDGQNRFHTVTMHGANDVGGPGNGDMGQAFDFDQDGDIDLLNGSEGGEWYLYRNTGPQGNYALVHVGYSPESKVDAISAEVIVSTGSHEYRKRVGSAGEIFSQSLLNTVHFGLGDDEKIKRIRVRWRNGETVEFYDKPVNRKFSTDRLDPESLSVAGSAEVRKGTSVALAAKLQPRYADPSVTWSSSDESALTVNRRGVVTALGEVGDTATITATSEANGIAASLPVTIVPWFALPATSVSIQPEELSLTVGQSAALAVDIFPENADDRELLWTTSDPDVVTVERGLVTAAGSGEAIIRAALEENRDLGDEVRVRVKPFVEAYVRIADEEKYKSKPLTLGESITLEVDYHAGSGNTVISADEGGMRFWLRHFRSKWFPVKDIVLTDPGVINTESGHTAMTIPLQGLIPTKDLPEGHFYQLRVSFTASDGQTHDATIYPLNIVEASAD